MNQIAAWILSLLFAESTITDKISVHWLYSWILFYIQYRKEVWVFFLEVDFVTKFISQECTDYSPRLLLKE